MRRSRRQLPCRVQQLPVQRPRLLALLGWGGPLSQRRLRKSLCQCLLRQLVLLCWGAPSLWGNGL